VLKAVTRCDKLNIAAIGNVVPQLHVHIVARRKDDPLWPKPVWGQVQPRPGDAAAFARFIAAIRNGLGLQVGG
jgi:diadenosine tetraphosphate (Ap4A) HIT family hydrolase